MHEDNLQAIENREPPSDVVRCASASSLCTPPSETHLHGRTVVLTEACKAVGLTYIFQASSALFLTDAQNSTLFLLLLLTIARQSSYQAIQLPTAYFAHYTCIAVRIWAPTSVRVLHTVPRYPRHQHVSDTEFEVLNIARSLHPP